MFPLATAISSCCASLVTRPTTVRRRCAARAVFLVQVADLLDNLREFLARRGQFVFYAENSVAELGSADELIIEQLSQALIQHLRRNSRYEPLDLARALHSSANCRQNGRRPLAAHDILQPAIRVPLT